MHEGLAANKIPVSALTAARLSVKLTFSEVPWSAPKREIFISQGKAVRTEKMNRGLMECDSNVATDEAVCVNRRSRNLYSVWMTADWGARVVSPSCVRSRVASVVATNSQWTINGVTEEIKRHFTCSIFRHQASRS
jgi:hypothetical protein